jgi:ABC-type sugar transport system permease subunit
MSEVQSWPPGWFPDPTGRHDHRWWDGAEWTAHVADAGVAASEPVDVSLQHSSASQHRPVAADGLASGAARTRDRVGNASLILGLIALPVALFPFLGLLVAGVALALALVLFAVAALRLGALGSGWSSVLIATWFAWIGTRFLGGGGIAGVSVVDGQAAITPLLFISGTQQVGAYNNLFIMIPFIWIYTGFAMVIFSAAIKGVPSDLLEAGRVDGATDSQSFWRIVLPQISPTIGVVITTIVVVVMKVFDIVKVMTNGNFGTQVLANEMWNRAFLDGNFGVGSAVAVILFLSVLPVMFLNIRRMQKEAA